MAALAAAWVTLLPAGLGWAQSGDTVGAVEDLYLIVESLDGTETEETAGHGESEPRVPNIVDGEPSEENRARNRRVEITYGVA